MIKDQIVTEDYTIINSDSNYVLPEMKSESIDLSVYSPPFRGLFQYSSMENDLSNCDSAEQFLEHYEYIVKEVSRVTKLGRISVVHCAEIINENGSNFDFPHEIIKLHEKHGFDYKNRISIWKEPLAVRRRTMVKSLMHKMIVEDSTQCFTAMPDYLLIFKKRGENKVPVTHPCGFKHYFGQYPMLLDHLTRLGLSKDSIQPIYDESAKRPTLAAGIEAYIWDSFRELQKKYMGFDETMDHKENILSHIIWRRYASSHWDDIRINNVLSFKESKEEEDEKHVHPLQLDVIDRVVVLYSNPGEVVFTPFMGVGSEVYSPVSLGRKGFGIELKESYYRQSVKNLAQVERRFVESQLTI